MSTFSFPTMNPKKEVFYNSLPFFFSHVESYYNSQIDSLSIMNTKYEKLVNQSQKNRKENQFFKKVLQKEEEKKVESAPEISKKIDDEILNTLSKAQEALKTTQEKL